MATIPAGAIISIDRTGQGDFVPLARVTLPDPAIWGDGQRIIVDELVIDGERIGSNGPLPCAPLRDDPDTFQRRADAWLYTMAMYQGGVITTAEALQAASSEGST